MTWEDFFLYVFVHFAKHYRGAGIGIKHLLDLWVVTKVRSNLNSNYIYAELKKMGLHKFYENVMDTVKVWFLGAEENDKNTLITNLIFSSGQYGTFENGVVNRAVLDHKGSSAKARFVNIIEGVFLPFGLMKKRYKILEKVSILLPIMWVVRWGEILLFRRYVFKVKMVQSKMMEQGNMDEHRNALQFVGLNIES